VAMGNSGLRKFREPLEKLATCGMPLVEEHAAWALAELLTPNRRAKSRRPPGHCP
jgi:hypothetical protein